MPCFSVWLALLASQQGLGQETTLQILWGDLKLLVLGSIALLAIFSTGRWLLARLGQPFDDLTEAAVFAWALGCLAIGAASLLLALLG